jgi:hypothetical protein
MQRKSCRSPLLLSITLAISASSITLASFAAFAAPPEPPAKVNRIMDNELSTAMRHDLGFYGSQTARYLDAERSAMAIAPEAKRRLGVAFAGLWIEQDDDGRFRTVVAAAHANAAAQARALAGC